MPTYVYRRPDGTTFEVSQKISDPKLTEDPETGMPVERVISGGAGLQFKGSGFYLTDYGRAGSPPKGDASGSSESGGSESGSSGSSSSEAPASDAKPAPKKATAAPKASSGSGD